MGADRRASRASPPSPRGQRLRGGEVVLGVQKRAEAADGDERGWVPIAEDLAPHLQRLAEQRLSGGEVALDVQQRAKVIDGAERARMPIAKRLAQPLQRLADNGSAAARSPLAFSSAPTLLMKLSVF